MGGDKSHGRAAGIINWHYSHRRSRRRRPFPKRNERGYGERSGVLARELGCFSFETIYHVTLLTDLPCSLRAESRIQGKRRACGFFWARPPIVCVRLRVTGQKPIGMRLCGSDPGRILALQSNPWIGRELPFILVEGVSTEGVAASPSFPSTFPWRLSALSLLLAVAFGEITQSIRSVGASAVSRIRMPLLCLCNRDTFRCKKKPQRSLAESPGLVGRSPCFFAGW